MRSFRHWTPRYIVDRIKLELHERRHPDYPWFTSMAVSILDLYLRKTDKGMEFGSGRSTPWLAKRVSSLTSIEMIPSYHEKVSAILRKQNITNVNLFLLERDVDEEIGKDSAYVRSIKQFKEESLDFILVDGHYRCASANAAVEYIRPGGILILDSPHHYLPSNSISPKSRKPDQGSISPQWEKFRIAVGQWRCMWTTDGTNDTAIYIRPSKE